MIKRKTFVLWCQTHFAPPTGKANRQRGDTLIEVLLAITILSIVAVGSMAVMNRGNALVQSALERTAIRAEVNSQTEMLNYVRDRNPNLWNEIRARATTVDRAKDNCLATRDKSFFLSFGGLTAATPTLSELQQINAAGDPVTQSSGRATAGNGLWIDAVLYGIGTTGNHVGYIDFYIKACWTPIGADVGTQSNSLTIVRMYDAQ